MHERSSPIIFQRSGAIFAIPTQAGLIRPDIIFGKDSIVSGHPDMPVFVFSARDVEAIIKYLNSIQEKPAPQQPAQ